MIKRGKCKGFILGLFLCCFVLGGVCFGLFGDFGKVLASSKSLANYSVVASAEFPKIHAMGGMCVYNDFIFYSKVHMEKQIVNGKEKDVDTYGRIYAYSLNNNQTYEIYNENSNNVDFYIGHANGIEVHNGYMYIAVANANNLNESVKRFKLNIKSNKIYLSSPKDFKVYDGDNNQIMTTGICYADDLGGFFVKYVNKIQFGYFNIFTGKFVARKTFILDENLGQGSITSKYKYRRQNIGYKDGKLYVPYTKANISYIASYDINKYTVDNSYITSDSYLEVGDNVTYKKLFEVEGLGFYNGKMYFVTNRKTLKNKTSDCICVMDD